MPGKMSAAEVSERVKALEGWSAEGGQELKKGFKFADHITAMGFVVRVAMAAEAMNHHPDLRMVYNQVEIKLSTHDAGGVTEQDFALAEKIEQYA